VRAQERGDIGLVAVHGGAGRKVAGGLDGGTGQIALSVSK
jgi:hypothetical protein